MEKPENDWESQRNELVDHLIERGYIETPGVERSFRVVPRHRFVPAEVENRAYQDTPLNIGEGQTISAPHMVAMMTEMLEIERGHKVLEIGVGRGYHAAITAEIAGAENVYTMERHESLAKEARRNLNETGYCDVKVVVGDGSKGLPEFAPYDRIYVTCAAPEIPDSLVEQLVGGEDERDTEGRMVVPVGRGSQTLYLVRKRGGEIFKDGQAGVRFVPLKGDEGF
ncbi:MAG: protein-L-isoaspartate(D-aspartate) O-methyltransferase [Halobacteria archaeon]|nr:protein-L-isoaspartate(D-aspartate) O-methyltransferase [Halobacteria archaeon]